jgi:hypothetical protein
MIFCSLSFYSSMIIIESGSYVISYAYVKIDSSSCLLMLLPVDLAIEEALPLKKSSIEMKLTLQFLNILDSLLNELISLVITLLLTADSFVELLIRLTL